MGITNCGHCEEPFTKKRKNRIYCSQTCSQLGQATSRRDDLSSFRLHLKSARCHVAKWKKSNIRPDLWEISVSLEDLKECWEKQEGKCPYTGWELNHRVFKGPFKNESSPNTASLDRIDSNKGYTKDNVQFVSLISQYAKNNWNEDILLKFGRALTRFDNLFEVD